MSFEITLSESKYVIIVIFSVNKTVLISKEFFKNDETDLRELNFYKQKWKEAGYEKTESKFEGIWVSETYVKEENK